MGKTKNVIEEDLEEVAAHSRRAFLTRGAAGAAVAVAGGAALTALAASPAAAAAADSVLLASPIRIFDSRPGQPFVGEGEGPGTPFVRGAASTSRQILFGDGETATDHIPSNALGAYINITITNTVATGALAWTGQTTVVAPTTSLINWSAAGQILANAALVPVTNFATGSKTNSNIAAGKAWIVAGTTGVSSTHFIVDVFGYVAGA